MSAQSDYYYDYQPDEDGEGSEFVEPAKLHALQPTDDPHIEYPDRSHHWQQRAACAVSNWGEYADSAPHNPEAFFPKRKEGGQCAPAKSLCLQCPVRVDCLITGLREPSGVWGGLSEKERRTAQKMVKKDVAYQDILDHFDSQQPQRRRNALMLMASDAAEVEAAGLTKRVIEQFMTTTGTVPVGVRVSAGRGSAGSALPSLPATTTEMTPNTSRELLREAERRRNGL